MASRPLFGFRSRPLPIAFRCPVSCCFAPLLLHTMMSVASCYCLLSPFSPHASLSICALPPPPFPPLMTTPMWIPFFGPAPSLHPRLFASLFPPRSHPIPLPVQVALAPIAAFHPSPRPAFPPLPPLSSFRLISLWFPPRYHAPLPMFPLPYCTLLSSIILVLSPLFSSALTGLS